MREVGHLAGVSHNAPYKHFADKDDLLATIAAVELARNQTPMASDADGLVELTSMLLAYVRWATRYPARFKLTFGPWTTASPQLADAASDARDRVVDAVRRSQAQGSIGAGDPDRIAALALALAHGAADLELSGHLSKSGKGHADAADLVHDLIDTISGRSS